MRWRLCVLAQERSEAQDTETAGRLWEISERQCAVSRRSAEARS